MRLSTIELQKKQHEIAVMAKQKKSPTNKQ